MLRIIRPAVSRRYLSTVMASNTPYEDIIRTRVSIPLSHFCSIYGLH